MSSIREDFENRCLFISKYEDIKNIDIFKDTNVIFETTQLKTKFFESLQLKNINHTVINCLSSQEMFEEMVREGQGILIFDNVCVCRNNYILETVINYKNRKMLLC